MFCKLDCCKMLGTRQISLKRPFNPRDLLLMLVVVTIYCIYETYNAVLKHPVSCSYQQRRELEQVELLETFRPFENDVILEYVPFGAFCNDSTWKFSECSNKSCTRILINSTAQYNFTIDDERRNVITADPTISVSPTTQNDLQSEKNTHLLSCDEIDQLWLSSKTDDFAKQEGGITSKKKHVFGISGIPNSTYIEIKEASVDSIGFQLLKQECEKRDILGWKAPGLVTLFGICSNNKTLRVVQEQAKGNLLCTEEMLPGMNFTNSNCYSLTHFKKLLQTKEDKAKMALTFIQSMTCFLANLEKKGFFVEDLAGRNFLIQSDMSIVYTKIDSLISYGSSNLYGGSICIHDYDCPKPNGTLWYAESTNSVLYQSCTDAKASCFRNKCVGYNGSMQLCGVSRWILDTVYKEVNRLQEKRTLIYYMRHLTTPYPSVRQSGTSVCQGLNALLSQHSLFEKKLTQHPVQRGYHVGLPPGVGR